MRIVVLDSPAECEHDQSVPSLWLPLKQFGSLARYDATPFPELIERARHADVVVSFTVPLRREVLDYVTRVATIAVPADRQHELVEMPIAEQLGIRVIPLPHRPNEPCAWIAALARELEVAAR